MPRLLLAMVFTVIIIQIGFSQNHMNMPDPGFDLPYRTIPDYPDSYNSANIAARMIDGLGFRYYWASENLREEDLEHRPNETARTCLETIDHIFSLSLVILNALEGKENEGGRSADTLSFNETRTQTLWNLKKSSDILRSVPNGDVDQFKIVFVRGETQSEFPFWNLINGPIADAIWHTGQIVSFRRTSGNPLDQRISLFMGNVRE